MYLAAVLGGLFGVSVAWGINYWFIMREKKADEEHHRELLAMKESYKSGR